ncbi:hypothetical protein BH11PAT1_BH11PAT1_7390 [soil metagenome]
MRKIFAILTIAILPLELFSQNQSSKNKIWNFCQGKFGIGINAIGGYLFNFDEVHGIPFFLGQPNNRMIVFPAPDLLIGNENKYYLSLGFAFDINNLQSQGSYQNHQAIKAYSSTTLWYFNANRTILKRPKSRYTVNVGLNFARTIVSSVDILYFTSPYDTIQYFFLGKFKQDFILNIGASAFFTRKDRNDAESSIGISFGYNVGTIKGKIIQRKGDPLVNPPGFNYSGPYIKIVMLQIWTKKKPIQNGM